MMSKDNEKRTVIGFIVSFLVIALGFLTVYINVRRVNSERLFYSLSPAEAFGGLEYDMEISKEWMNRNYYPNVSLGAEYDGSIINNTGSGISNWTLTLGCVCRDAVIDSSWDGEYLIEDGVISITPLDYNTDIRQGDKINFGFVLYSTVAEPFDVIGVSFYKNVKITGSPFFWVFVALMVLWVILLVIHIGVAIQTHYYRIRHRLDSEIIVQSMNTFTGFLDAKDTYTNGHSERVAAYSREIGRRMHMDEETQTNLYYVALMHDCGKIGVDDAILRKPGKLTKEEFDQIKAHTTIGYEILKNFTAIPDIRDGAHYHHERYDGNGYPEGLKGNEIPLFARIICIADSYDAMSSKRCYRDPFPADITIEELRSNAGRQFDPDIVQYMIDMINDGFTGSVLKAFEAS